MGEIREFETGATRDTDEGKLDYEGFLSPRVIEEFARYMNKNRVQSDGSLRASDNWQKGIPKDQYMKSAWRHFMDLWKGHRGLPTVPTVEACCAIMFNVMGYLHETLKADERDEIVDFLPNQEPLQISQQLNLNLAETIAPVPENKINPLAKLFRLR